MTTTIISHTHNRAALAAGRFSDRAAALRRWRAVAAQCGMTTVALRFQLCREIGCAPVAASVLRAYDDACDDADAVGRIVEC